MKTVLLGDVSFSKVVCGTNPFYGRSHFSEARDTEYRARFTDEMILRMMRECLARGVNTFESCANERILTLLASLRKESAEPVHLMGSTRIDDTSDIKSHQGKLSLLITSRAAVCVVHSQFVDRPGKGDGISRLEPMIDAIHAAGLLAGISTHRVRIVELCEQKRYGIDTYLFPLNLSGFVYPGYDGTESVQQRVDLVRGINKPFILMKTLGAGRIPPDEGLHFVLQNSKPNDLISLGFGPKRRWLSHWR